MSISDKWRTFWIAEYHLVAHIHRMLRTKEEQQIKQEADFFPIIWGIKISSWKYRKNNNWMPHFGINAPTNELGKALAATHNDNNLALHAFYCLLNKKIPNKSM